tara:strand:+ start:4504 stop:4833 length:330 start_codon:yes stop_codon:yes gene_type:complete
MPNLEEKDFEPNRNNDEWRSRVVDHLQSGYGLFTFQKADGSIREMKCTLKHDDIPETSNLKSNSKPGQLVVWDYEVEGWRIVTFEKILSWISLGPNKDRPENEQTWARE